MNRTNAPWWAGPALRFLVGRDRWQNVAGDLLEEYRETILPARGKFQARLWYVAQVASFATPLKLGIAGGALAAVVIVVTNVVLPAAGVDFAYSAGTETACNAICGAALLLLWVIAGLAGLRRERSLPGAVRSGAILALVQMAMVMLTFFVVNNLFLGIVSRQPDKAWGFAHSNAASMRAYTNTAALRGVAIALPIFVVIGAVCGAAGGLLGAWTGGRSAAG